jgi:hypothetical protein
MHFPVRRTFMRCLSVMLLAGAVWTTQPSSGVVAGAFDIMTRSISEKNRLVFAAEYHALPQTMPRRHAEFQMIELHIIACRKNNCRDVSLLYDPYQISLMTCMVVGQQEAAKWQSSNPTWRIRRWSCRFARPTQKAV